MPEQPRLCTQWSAAERHEVGGASTMRCIPLALSELPRETIGIVRSAREAVLGKGKGKKTFGKV